MISNFLHDHLSVGDRVSLSSPSGTFILPENLDRPFVFISGGVGLTPFISMVEHLSAVQQDVPISWIHGCRNSEVHAFKGSIERLAESHSGLSKQFFYNQCSEEDLDSDILEGHLDLSKVNNLHQGEQTQYYICGPSLFIEKQFADLRLQGVAESNIHYEEFGPQVINLN